MIKIGLFVKKCEYCKKKIKRGKETKKDVKVLGYIGTRPKNFCCEEHASNYKQELEEHMKNPRKSGGGCCG